MTCDLCFVPAGVTMHFSEIIKLQFKKERHTWLCISKLFTNMGPVPQKPINANLRLKINQAVNFSTPKCCSTQIFYRTLHEKTSILKNKNKQKKLSPQS